MKHEPTQFQSSLINRRADASRFSKRRAQLNKRLFSQAMKAVRTRKLRMSPGDLLEHWEQCTPDSPSKGNTIQLDDLGTEFQTLAQSLGAEVVSLDNLEEYGDTHISQEEQETAQEKLRALLDWEHDIHTVTSERHLPNHLAHETDKDDPEAHLEPEFTGFSGIDSIGAERPDGIPIEWRKTWRYRKNSTYRATGYPLRDCVD